MDPLSESKDRLRRRVAQSLGTWIASHPEEWRETAAWVLDGYPPAHADWCPEHEHRPIVGQIQAKAGGLIRLGFGAKPYLDKFGIDDAKRVLFLTALLYDADFNRDLFGLSWPRQCGEGDQLADDLTEARQWGIEAAEGGYPDIGDVWGTLIDEANEVLGAKRPGWPRLGTAALPADTTAATVSGGIIPEAPAKPASDDDDFLPGQWFALETRIPTSRLRQATRPGRKTKRVEKRTIDGVVCYSVSDAGRWWPNDMTKA